MLRVTFYPSPIGTKQLQANESGPSRDQVGIKLGSSRDLVGVASELSKEYLELLRYCEQPRSITEMMDFLGWKSRAKFRLRVINALLEQKLLAMTQPDKPNSAKQRYISLKQN